MSNIIASGTTETTSSDITVAAGSTPTLFITSTTGAVQPDARAAVQMKSAAGVYMNIGELNYRQPALTIFGTGTFRVKRLACVNAIAVDQS